MTRIKAFSGRASQVERDIEQFNRYFVGNILSVVTTSAPKPGSTYSSEPDFLVVITYNEDIQDG